MLAPVLTLSVIARVNDQFCGVVHPHLVYPSPSQIVPLLDVNFLSQSPLHVILDI